MAAAAPSCRLALSSIAPGGSSTPVRSPSPWRCRCRRGRRRPCSSKLSCAACPARAGRSGRLGSNLTRAPPARWWRLPVDPEVSSELKASASPSASLADRRRVDRDAAVLVRRAARVPGHRRAVDPVRFRTFMAASLAARSACRRRAAALDSDRCRHRRAAGRRRCRREPVVATASRDHVASRARADQVIAACRRRSGRRRPSRRSRRSRSPGQLSARRCGDDRRRLSEARLGPSRAGLAACDPGRRRGHCDGSSAASRAIAASTQLRAGPPYRLPSLDRFCICLVRSAGSPAGSERAW